MADLHLPTMEAAAPDMTAIRLLIKAAMMAAMVVALGVHPMAVATARVADIGSILKGCYGDAACEHWCCRVFPAVCANVCGVFVMVSRAHLRRFALGDFRRMAMQPLRFSVGTASFLEAMYTVSLLRSPVLPAVGAMGWGS